jgi:hypothetical protein
VWFLSILQNGGFGEKLAASCLEVERREEFLLPARRSFIKQSKQHLFGVTKICQI